MNSLEYLSIEQFCETYPFTISEINALKINKEVNGYKESFIEKGRTTIIDVKCFWKCYENLKEIYNKKQRVTVQVNASLLDHIKDAVYWTPGLTLSSLVENALNNEIYKMEKENGTNFAPRKEDLKMGRPIK